jgi:hypothetical protein
MRVTLASSPRTAIHPHGYYSGLAIKKTVGTDGSNL